MNKPDQGVTPHHLAKWHWKVVDRPHDGFDRSLGLAIGVSHGTIRNIREKKVKQATLQKLKDLPFHEYARAMGLHQKFESNAQLSEADLIRLCDEDEVLQRCQTARSADDYAACCHLLGLPLKQAYLPAALDRVDAWQRDKALARLVTDEALPPLPQAWPAFLHEAEIKAVQEIAHHLMHGQSVLEVWSDPHDGGDMLLRHLRCCDGLWPRFQRIIHVNADLTLPDAARHSACSDRASRHLGRWMGGTQPVMPQAAADWLRKEKALLILHGASVALDLPDEQIGLSHYQSQREERSFWNELIRLLQVRPSHAGLIVATWQTHRLRIPDLDLPQDQRLQRRPRISGPAVMSYLRQMLDHSCRARGMTDWRAVRNDGPLWKRLRHHYRPALNQGEEVSPLSVRFRAMCASHVDNLSALDPTQGLTAMIGDVPAITADFEPVVRELRAFLRLVELGNGGKAQLQALRLVSTGVHWFSQTMSAHLAGPEASGMPIRTACGEDFGIFVKQARERKQICAVAPLIVKAVVQDDWRDRDHVLRRQIHHAIGTRLAATMEDSTRLLEEEYPFQPPWKDGRIILWAEAVRHFARACAALMTGAGQGLCLIRGLIPGLIRGLIRGLIGGLIGGRTGTAPFACWRPRGNIASSWNC